VFLRTKPPKRNGFWGLFTGMNEDFPAAGLLKKSPKLLRFDECPLLTMPIACNNVGEVCLMAD